MTNPASVYPLSFCITTIAVYGRMAGTIGFLDTAISAHIYYAERRGSQSCLFLKFFEIFYREEGYIFLLSPRYCLPVKITYCNCQL